MRAGLISVPVSSVIVWIVFENSIWSRRGQVEAVLLLHDVGDAALARLAVDPDDGLVGAADVLRVDRAGTGTPTPRSPAVAAARAKPFLMASWWLPENDV